MSNLDNETYERVVNKNKYMYRNIGFIASIIILIVINYLTYKNPDLTNNQTEVYTTTINICMFYMLGYLANNTLDFYSKVSSFKKTS